MEITIPRDEVTSLHKNALMTDTTYAYMALRFNRGPEQIQVVDAPELMTSWGLESNLLMGELARLVNVGILKGIELDQFSIDWLNDPTVMTKDELLRRWQSKIIDLTGYVYFALKILAGSSSSQLIKPQTLKSDWGIDSKTLFQQLKTLVEAEKVKTSLGKLFVTWAAGAESTGTYSELEQEKWISNTRDRWGTQTYNAVVQSVSSDTGVTTIHFKNGQTLTEEQTWQMNWGQIDMIAGVNQLPPPPPTTPAADDPWIVETRTRWVANHGEQLVNQKLVRVDYVDEVPTMFFSNGKTMNQEESWSINWGEQEAFAGLT